MQSPPTYTVCPGRYTSRSVYNAPSSSGWHLSLYLYSQPRLSFTGKRITNAPSAAVTPWAVKLSRTYTSTSASSTGLPVVSSITRHCKQLSGQPNVTTRKRVTQMGYSSPSSIPGVPSGRIQTTYNPSPGVSTSSVSFKSSQGWPSFSFTCTDFTRRPFPFTKSANTLRSFHTSRESFRTVSGILNHCKATVSVLR